MAVREDDPVAREDHERSAERLSVDAELRRRTEESEALYRLADAVRRAASLDEVFAAGLAGLELVGAEKGAVLLLDDEGVMRFRAWRGLSAEYRTAVEGHSPWAPDDPAPRPVVVPDAAADASLAQLRESIAAEGVRSLAFVPLVHGARLLGKVMLYAGAPEAFGPDQVRLAEAIAGHVASEVVRRRAEDALRTSRAELEAIFRSVADGITAQRADGRLVFANDAAASLIGFADAADLLGAAESDLVGRFELIDADGRPFPLDELPGRLALATGRPHERLIGYRVPPAKAVRWSVVRATPILGADGPELAINVFRDVTASRRAEERLRFLAEASRLLAASLDVEQTLHEITRLAVPTLGDYCLVDLVDEATGALRCVAIFHVEAEGEALLREIRGRYPPAGNASHPASRVAVSGEPLVFRHVDEADLASASREEGHLELYHRLQASSYLVVPLRARGRVLGTISLGTSAASEREYDDDDLALAQELADRAAVAVDNARLYGESQASLALLESVVEGTTDHVFVKERDGRYLMINSAGAREFGSSKEEIVGRTAQELLGDQGESYMTNDAVVLATEQWHTFEETLDGRTYLATKGPYRAPDGSVVGVVGVARDITERKRAQDRLAFLVEASALLASSLDIDDTLHDLTRLIVPRFAEFASVWMPVGDELVRVAGAAPTPELDALMERGITRFRITADSAAPAVQVYLSGEPQLSNDADSEIRDERTLRRLASAGLRSVIGVPLSARGRSLGVLAVSARRPHAFDESDVAFAVELARRAAVAVDNAMLFTALEQQRAEAAERAEAARALEFVGDGVVVAGGEGEVRLWNPAAERITGLAAEDVVGRRLGELPLGWPEIRELGGRAQTFPVDVAGRELWLSISAVAFPEGTVYAFRDLTEEHLVERLKTDFVSTVSHELRTPLAAIYGAAMTLRRTDVDLDSMQRESLLAVVASEAERLARIVNDVLWASRLESGILDVSIESCDAAALAASVVRAAGTHLPERIDLGLEVADGVPRVAADPDKVRQVLVNLLDNAVKYSPDGGRVTVAVTADERYVRFAIRDEGLGIPHGELDRIFEKFYRLDPNMTRGIGGTGLGLYICRELVRRMNGRIAVASEPGRGSTFTVELPVAR